MRRQKRHCSQIKPEERSLLAKFGRNFADHLGAVRRWI